MPDIDSANEYKGTDITQLDIDAEKSRSNEEPLYTLTEEDANPQFTFYKHKQCMRFEIPRANGELFAFRNGICRVKDSDLEEFLTAIDGLHQGDRGNIVRIRNIQNEVPMEKRVHHGAASTSTIKAPAENRPAPTATAPVRAGIMGLGARVTSTPAPKTE